MDALLASGTDCFRIANSPDCHVERFGTACLVSTTSDADCSALSDEIRRRVEGVEAVYLRRLVRAPGKDDAPQAVFLASPGTGPRFVTREAGSLYEVDFSAGYSCGLFLDQRANRSHLAALSPTRLLNCFAFTCSFSVRAARAGAVTTNIDLSKRILERGRRNFSLNQISPEGHHFYPDDVFECLPRLARRGERFDTIILDPPTFSRGRGGKVFRAEKDLAALLHAALACATNGAHILLSTNCIALSRHALRRIARSCCPAARDFHETNPLPDIPAESSARTLWFRKGE